MILSNPSQNLILSHFILILKILRIDFLFLNIFARLEIYIRDFRRALATSTPVQKKKRVREVLEKLQPQPLRLKQLETGQGKKSYLVHFGKMKSEGTITQKQYNLIISLYYRSRDRYKVFVSPLWDLKNYLEEGTELILSKLEKHVLRDLKKLSDLNTLRYKKIMKGRYLILPLFQEYFEEDFRFSREDIYVQGRLNEDEWKQLLEKEMPPFFSENDLRITISTDQAWAKSAQVWSKIPSSSEVSNPSETLVFSNENRVEKKEKFPPIIINNNNSSIVSSFEDVIEERGEEILKDALKRKVVGDSMTVPFSDFEDDSTHHTIPEIVKQSTAAVLQEIQVLYPPEKQNKRWDYWHYKKLLVEEKVSPSFIRNFCSEKMKTQKGDPKYLKSLQNLFKDDIPNAWRSTLQLEEKKKDTDGLRAYHENELKKKRFICNLEGYVADWKFKMLEYLKSVGREEEYYAYFYKMDFYRFMERTYIFSVKSGYMAERINNIFRTIMKDMIEVSKLSQVGGSLPIHIVVRKGNE